MSDLAETLWREFGVETEEHFEIIEPLLVAAETQAVVAADIAQLFRSFHSVKGLARSMDMKGMEEAAHHAENALGLVREGSCALDAELIGLLLATVDVLKGLRQQAVSARHSAPAPPDLIARLEAAFAARNAAVPPPARPAEATSQPAVQAAPAAAVAAPEETAPPIGPDPEMLTYFAEMAREHLPSIARAATSEIADDGVRQTAIEAIDTLAHATDVMGFEGLGGSLATLRALLDAPPSDDTYFRAVDALGRIRTEIEVVEREVNTEIAGEDLAIRLRGALQTEVHGNIDGMLDVLSQFSGDGARAAVGDETLAEELVGFARSACTFFVFLNLRQSSRLMLMVEDVFTRVATREMHLYPELLALTREAAALLSQVAKGSGGWADLGEGAVDGLLERLRQAILVGAKPGDGADPVSTLKRVLQDYDISAELVEILSPENIQDLVHAVHNGRTNLFEILADLEGSETLTLAFVAWMREDATAITNRTVFIDGRTWFEFLVVSHLDTATVQAHIAALDPGRAALRLRPCPMKARPETRPATPAAAGTRRAAAPTEAAGAAGKSGGTVLRVRGETVDQLMAHIGEMVTISNMVHAAVKTAELDTTLARLRDLVRTTTSAAEAASLFQTLETAWQTVTRADEQLGSAVGRLQDATLDLRVVAIDTLFNRFPRVVRDIALVKGKQVRLETVGAEVRIDKGMVELLLDPLMHMVRNAVDHGIEDPDERKAAGKSPIATVRLVAASRGNRVEIEIADDGRGLNIERIRRKAVERGLIGAAEAERLPVSEVVNFIFAPGFSTANEVSETSGRGVGMDVVHTNIMRMGGTISLDTKPGRGTTVSLQLPLSAAIQRVLMVETAGRPLAIPERFLAEIHEVAEADYQSVRGQPAILLRQKFLPVFRLSELLGYAAPAAEGWGCAAAGAVVVLVRGRQRIGIRVDRLLRRQELFIREIHPDLAAIPGVGGASIAGDGSVVLIVDGDDLFRLAERRAGLRGGMVH